MSDALRFEWVRLRTVRSTYWLLALALLLNALIALAIGLATRSAQSRDFESDGLLLTGATQFVPLPFAAVLAGLVGILAMGHEYRHDTIRPTLTALPRRSDLVAAKVAVVAAVGALLAVASVALNWLVGLLARGEPPSLTGDGTAAALGGYVIFVALWGALGVAATLLVRNVIGVIVALLVLPLVVEPLLSILSNVPALDWLEPIVRYLPFRAGSRMVATVELSDVFGGEQLGRVASGLVFAGLVALVLVPAWVLFERRDA